MCVSCRAVLLCRVDDKPAALLHLLRSVVPVDQLTILFIATRHHAEFIHNLLKREGIEASCVFGSMDQVSAVPWRAVPPAMVHGAIVDRKQQHLHVGLCIELCAHKERRSQP